MSDVKKEEGVVKKTWNGFLAFIGVLAIIIFAVFLFGPGLGMFNSGVRGVNTEFQNTPMLITGFGISFNQTLMAFARIIITALVLSFLIWLAIDIFASIVSKKKDDHAHGDGHH
ncbi:MAG: hypothetical protein KBC21_03225 [Candidatus Pacebacteria bacterium]|nr:hypothetical protein [Candidatus Paceibacterota bacterium]